MSVNSVDVVVGLQYGDEAKGKITHHLLSKSNYDFVCRSSGGPNAGHTIYHRDKKIVTHISIHETTITPYLILFHRRL